MDCCSSNSTTRSSNWPSRSARAAATSPIRCGFSICPNSVRSQIEQGNLTAGHARALVATDSPAELADQIIKLGLSVREAEGLARDAGPSRKPKPKAEKDADTKALEKTVVGGNRA